MLGLGFRVRLGPGYIYRLYIHDLPHVPRLRRQCAAYAETSDGLSGTK